MGPANAHLSAPFCVANQCVACCQVTLVVDNVLFGCYSKGTFRAFLYEACGVRKGVSRMDKVKLLKWLSIISFIIALISFLVLLSPKACHLLACHDCCPENIFDPCSTLPPSDNETAQVLHELCNITFTFIMASLFVSLFVGITSTILYYYFKQKKLKK